MRPSKESDTLQAGPICDHSYLFDFDFIQRIIFRDSIKSKLKLLLLHQVLAYKANPYII